MRRVSPLAAVQLAYKSHSYAPWFVLDPKHRRLDEVTPSQIRQLMAYARACWPSPAPGSSGTGPCARIAWSTTAMG